MADEKKAPASQGSKPEETGSRIIWDDSRMAMNYANVCNVSSTKEEFNLLFGTNQTWATGQKDVRVQLSNRLILNPYAAKRLSLLLAGAVKQYEDKVGEIPLDVTAKDLSTSRH